MVVVVGGGGRIIGYVCIRVVVGGGFGWFELRMISGVIFVISFGVGIIFVVGGTGNVIVGRMGAGAVFGVAFNRGVGDLSRRIVMEDATVEYCTDVGGCVVGEGGGDSGNGILMGQLS